MFVFCVQPIQKHQHTNSNMKTESSNFSCIIRVNVCVVDFCLFVCPVADNCPDVYTDSSEDSLEGFLTFTIIYPSGL